MNRRCFLATSVGSAASMAAASQEMEPTVRLGFSTYGCTGLTLDEAIDRIAAVGFEAVELCCLPGQSADPQKHDAASRRALAKRLADRNLEAAGVMVNLSPLANKLAAVDDLARAAAFGAEIACGAPPPVETVLGGKPGSWAEVRD
ncbi:MAG: sugar phosphate isomerase/epimerase family protein, partial [Planctomycetia bacterium]